MKTTKKILSALCAMLLAGQGTALAASEVITSPSFAGIVVEDVEDFGYYGTTDNEQPTTEELEAVIKAAKPKLDIPESFSEFSWDYYGGNTRTEPYWTMRWSTPGTSQVYGHASVSCDKAGNIKNFNIYSDEQNANAFPAYTKNELIETAKKYVKKLAPDANLVFDKAQDAYGRYSRFYTYTFKRTENGIDYPENNATVRIDYVTGKLTYFNLSYDYGIGFSSNKAVVTPELAASILGTRQEMILSYTLLRETDENGNTVNKAVLVYSPKESYLAVDAVTGEVYDTRTEWTNGTAAGDVNAALKGEVMEDAAESEEGGYRLTEEELAQLEVLKGLITKEEAVAKITGNEKFYLDMSLTAVSANLSRSYNYYSSNKEEEGYVWHISFSNPLGGEKYYYSYADASVDAKTGEIISFNSSLRNSYYYEQNELEAPEVKFSQEQAEKIFEDFVKTQIPEKLELTRKQDTYMTNAIKYNTEIVDGNEYRTPVYGAYGINYVRVNEGLDFTYNNIYGAVDGVTGKIYSYGYSWIDDVVFESPKNAMTKQEALKVYLEKAEFDTYYERHDTYTLKKLPANSPEEKFRACVLEIKENTADYEAIIKKYAPDADLDGIKKAILAADEYTLLELLAKAFGVKEYDIDIFYNSAAELYDRESTARLVYKTNISNVRISALTGERVNYSGKPVVEEFDGEFSDISEHWAKDYITILADLGIIERAPEFLPDSFVTEEEFDRLLSASGLYGYTSEGAEGFTRLLAVKHIIASLGYDKVASLDIYRTEFSDNPEIDAADVGYVAIAYGLGIIDGDAGTKTFRPNEQITKAEAAKLIVETIKAGM